jgi:hypothetical protein
MTDHVWYLQATTDPGTARGYMPVGYNGPDRDKVFAALRALSYRAEIGERVDPSEFPVEYEAVNTDPSRNLNLPMWYSTLRHVRADMVAVMRNFDIGRTVFAPIRITLPDGAGVREDFSVLSVSDLKDTVDPALSSPLKRGRKRWGPLYCSGAVDTTIVARRSVVEGPDIWTDRQVASAVFVSDRLAQAMRAESWGVQVKLRPVRVANFAAEAASGRTA